MRIDPSRKKRFEPRVDARAAECSLHERIEAEAREVTLVEHDRMAQRDRLAVVRLVYEEIENLARSLAIAAVPGDDERTVEPGGMRWRQRHRSKRYTIAHRLATLEDRRN